MKVLLLAGWGFTEEIWHPVEKEMAEKWEIKKVDFLAEDFARVDAPQYPEIIKDKITRFQPEVAIGWSLGAIVLLETAVEYRLSNLSTVILSGSSRFVETDEPGPPGINLVRLRAMRRGIKQNPERTLQKFYKLVARPGDEEPAYGKLEGIKNYTTRLRKGLKYLQEVDFTEELDSIEVPVDLIHGKSDGVIPIMAGRYLADNLERARLVELEGGHLAPLQQVKILRELLE